MDPGTQDQSAKVQLASLLAGLEGGTVGVLWMLAWLGVNSQWQQRGFWAAENLMSTAFDRNAALAPAFTWSTCGGLALYVVIYSALGAIFAAILRDRLPRQRVMLLALVFALVWYYVSFRLLFQYAMPLVSSLHVARPTMVGHLLYGFVLGRYPVYVHRLMATAPPDPQPPPAPQAPSALEAPSEGPASPVLIPEAAGEHRQPPPPPAENMDL